MLTFMLSSLAVTESLSDNVGFFTLTENPFQLSLTAKKRTSIKLQDRLPDDLILKLIHPALHILHLFPQAHCYSALVSLSSSVSAVLHQKLLCPSSSHLLVWTYAQKFSHQNVVVPLSLCS